MPPVTRRAFCAFQGKMLRGKDLSSAVSPRIKHDTRPFLFDPTCFFRVFRCKGAGKEGTREPFAKMSYFVRGISSVDFFNDGAPTHLLPMCGEKRAAALDKWRGICYDKDKKHAAAAAGGSET